MREMSERLRVISRCPVKVFVASYIPRYWYPYRLQHAGKARDWAKDESLEVILDSAIMEEDIGNRETLDRAHEVGADYVIPNDTLHDQEATTDAVRAFADLYEEHPCSATPLIPLQPPYDEHYRELDQFSHYVLGGMAVPEVGTAEQIRHIRAFGNVVHDGAYVHALGVGGGRKFVKTVAPLEILDSVDCATPEIAAANGCVIDADLKQREVREYNGTGAKKRNRPLAEFNSWQLQDVWDRERTKARETKQTGANGWA